MSLPLSKRHPRDGMMAGNDPENYYWRVGRKVRRTIYAMHDHFTAHEDDVLIGMMDTPALAKAAVDAHNTDLRIRNSR